MRVVISLCGRKRSGKESAYKCIQQYVEEAEEFQFATPLKKFCIEVLGLTHDQCYGADHHRESKTKYMWGGINPEIREKYGKDPNEAMTARDVLQVVGTDLMRHQFYQDIWAEGAIREALRSSAKTAIITDTRFPNEVNVTRQAPTMDSEFRDSVLVRLYRKTGLEDSHESETALDIYDLYPNQRSIQPKDHTALISLGYTKIRDSLWRGDASLAYDYLLDNNHSLDVLRQNMITILKEQGIYTEPTCS